MFAVDRRSLMRAIFLTSVFPFLALFLAHLPSVAGQEPPGLDGFPGGRVIAAAEAVDLTTPPTVNTLCQSAGPLHGTR